MNTATCPKQHYVLATTNKALVLHLMHQNTEFSLFVLTGDLVNQAPRVKH